MVARTIARFGGQATAGDYLSFLGGILGAFLAVVGAVAVEDRKRAVDARRELTLIDSALQELRVAMVRIVKTTVDDGRPLTDQKQDVLRFMTGLEDARAALEFARSSARVDNIALFMALRSLDRAIETHEAMVTRETAIIRENNPTPGILKVYRDRMSAFTEALGEPLNRAQALLQAAF